MQMTIRQLANELGVSKTTINKIISGLGVQHTIQKVGNKYLLSETQILQIKMQLAQNEKSKTENLKSQTDDQKSKTENLKSQTDNQNLILILEKQLSLLNEQLAIKDEQIMDYREQIKFYQEQILMLTQSLHDATTALTAEQALHAGTIRKQLTEYSTIEQSSDESKQPKQGLLSRLFERKRQRTRKKI